MIFLTLVTRPYKPQSIRLRFQENTKHFATLNYQTPTKMREFDQNKKIKIFLVYNSKIKFIKCPLEVSSSTRFDIFHFIFAKINLLCRRTSFSDASWRVSGFLKDNIFSRIYYYLFEDYYFWFKEKTNPLQPLLLP